MQETDMQVECFRISLSAEALRSNDPWGSKGQTMAISKPGTLFKACWFFYLKKPLAVEVGQVYYFFNIPISAYNLVLPSRYT